MSADVDKAVQTETRKLAAIMFTDMVGFSRQMGADEARMLRLLHVHDRIIQQAVTEHHGTIIKTGGDSFLVDFPSVVHAVQCARQIQAQLQAHNTEQDKAEQIQVRIGIHLGDIVQRGHDVFGDGVNIAKRLQELAEPDTICISQKVYEEVHKKLALGTAISLGRPGLKNITERFPVYALLPEPPKGLRQTFQLQRLKLRQWRRPLQIALAILVVVWAGVVTLRSFRPSPPPGQPQGVTPPGSHPALPLPDKPSIVVLPFDNMSGDPQQDYFSNGITEVLTSDLSRISSLFVIARNTAFTYKGKAANVQDVGKELGVRYVLEGSVQKASDQVRIVAQLVDTTTGRHIWSERYDRPLKDIFALQDEIVQQIVTTLKLQLMLREQGILVRKATDNLEAYDYYLRGMEYRYRFTNEANVQARQMFERAIVLDPAYAEAYAELGWTYYVEWSFQWSQDPQALERALALGQKVIALDDSLARAHGLLGFVYARKQQYDQAVVEGERAIALDPNNADGYALQAGVLLFAGRPAEALWTIEQGMRLNPHSPAWYLQQLGNAYQGTGRYEEAIAAYKQLFVRNPNFLWAYPNLAFSYLAQWDFQQSPNPQTLGWALEAAQRAVTLNDSLSFAHVTLGAVYLGQKQYEPAIAEMERAIALDPNLANGYAGLAGILSRVGRSEEALWWVEQALRRKPLAVDQHLSSIGGAYYLAGRPEEAIAPLKQFLSRYRNILGPHLTLAAVYSELGREAEAQAEAAEVLRLNPQFSLEVHKQRAPIEDPEVLERYLAALRKAGLK